MKKILALIFLTFTFNSYAGLYLEPYLGYQMGAPDSSTYSDSSGSGVVLGGRVGFGMLGFFSAFDYSLSSYSFSYKISNVEIESDADITEMALAVGYDLPIIPLKFFGKYIFKSTVDYDGGGENDFNGIDLGVGLTILPFVDINMEYKALSCSDDNCNSDLNLYMLSASLPFTF